MKPRLYKILDVAVQIFIVTGFVYAAYQLLVVFAVPGQPIVLFGRAVQIDFQILVMRRLYALEFWIIFTSYLVYLGNRKRIWNLK